jgi:hypothetical protein
LPEGPVILTAKLLLFHIVQDSKHALAFSAEHPGSQVRYVRGRGKKKMTNMYRSSLSILETGKQRETHFCARNSTASFA